MTSDLVGDSEERCFSSSFDLSENFSHEPGDRTSENDTCSIEKKTMQVRKAIDDRKRKLILTLQGNAVKDEKTEVNKD